MSIIFGGQNRKCVIKHHHHHAELLHSNSIIARHHRACLPSTVTTGAWLFYQCPASTTCACRGLVCRLLRCPSRVSSIGGTGGGGEGREASPPNTPASPPNFSVIMNLKTNYYNISLRFFCTVGILLWSALRIIRNTTMVSMECTTSSNLWM